MKILNLVHFINISRQITSFDSVYRLVSCLGLRHIIVVDSGYKVNKINDILRILLQKQFTKNGLKIKNK